MLLLTIRLLLYSYWEVQNQVYAVFLKLAGWQFYQLHFYRPVGRYRLNRIVLSIFYRLLPQLKFALFCLQFVLFACIDPIGACMFLYTLYHHREQICFCCRVLNRARPEPCFLLWLTHKQIL